MTALDRSMGGQVYAGSYLRGVLDADPRLLGVAAVIANAGIPVKLFDFPAHLLIKKRWFDFELQAQPFADAAIIVPDWSSRLSKDWLWATRGTRIPSSLSGGHQEFHREGQYRLGPAHHPRDPFPDGQTSSGYSPYEFFFGTGLWF